MSIQSNLYPPIMKTYLPACNINGDSFRIYFSISDYNGIESIGIPQVSITNQKTNKSIFINDTKTNQEPAVKSAALVVDEIYLGGTITLDDNINDDFKYYIEIPRACCKSIDINTYYKVQIRFTKSNLERPEINNAAAWITENYSYFSEWSTVCLIRFMEYPTLDIEGYELCTKEKLDTTLSIYQSKSTVIRGKLIYPNSEESDYLKSYKISVIDAIDSSIVETSGVLYPQNINELSYDFKYNFVEGNSYIIKIDILTMSMYSTSMYSRFMTLNSGSDEIKCLIKAIPEDDYGRMRISIDGGSNTVFSGNYTIRRAESKNNYNTWSDFKTFFIDDKSTTKIDNIYDYTVESGVYYKYCIQKRKADGSRGMITESEPAMIYLDSIYINGDNRQLKLQYNSSITSSIISVMESKIETLGSKYPFVTRNGSVEYKTLSLNGLITILNDIYGERIWFHNIEDDNKVYIDPNAKSLYNKNYLTPIGSDSLFTNKNELFGKEFERYANYINNNDISLSTNRIYEKAYREKVIEFLYEGKVRLIRTPDEGNILVKLMNVTLTPNSTLNGLIYDFSAQAIEICESNLDNYNDYDIQYIGDIKDSSLYHTRFGQEFRLFKGSSSNATNKKIKKINNNVVESIILDKYIGAYSGGYNTSTVGLTYLKIDFISDPYFITGTRGDESTYRKMTAPPSSPNSEGEKPIAIGYLIKINGRVLIIPQSQSTYVLRGNDIMVTSLEFLEDTYAEIDYEIKLEEKEKLFKLSSESTDYKIGQLWGTFNPGVKQRKEIAYKYSIHNKTHFQTLNAIDGIEIEADDGVIVYVKETLDAINGGDFSKHIINKTNILTFYDEEKGIEDFYFDGRRFYRDLNDFDKIIPYNQFSYMGEYKRLTGGKEIIVPVNNGLYFETYTKKYYLYYNNSWNVVTNNIDNIDECEYIEVKVPVDAIVNYLFEIKKGVY